MSLGGSGDDKVQVVMVRPWALGGGPVMLREDFSQPERWETSISKSVHPRLPTCDSCSRTWTLREQRE